MKASSPSLSAGGVGGSPSLGSPGVGGQISAPGQTNVGQRLSPSSPSGVSPGGQSGGQNIGPLTLNNSQSPSMASGPSGSPGSPRSPKSPRGARVVTMELIDKSMGRVRRRRGESMEQCCLRVTHLRLQSRKLTGGLDNVVRWCPGLKVLYAYDNMLREAQISHKLEHLFLQDNLLTSLRWMKDAHSLKYLNVGNNCIPELIWHMKDDDLLRIEKINISKQRPMDHDCAMNQDLPTLIINRDFLQTKLAHCLKELCIADNQLTSLNVLSCLVHLTFLDAENNHIWTFADIYEFLEGCQQMRTLQLTGNPLCLSSLHSWRDPIVVACENIVKLNDKEVSDNEKAFVRALVATKQKIASPR